MSINESKVVVNIFVNINNNLLKNVNILFIGFKHNIMIMMSMMMKMITHVHLVMTYIQLMQNGQHRMHNTSV